ncbi:DUF86 domain-containing protein [Phocaeicola plebeius]|jgi:uncharacterized protein with HEPN domain|uniref:HepT-like ribonuclease domain-containing protein n=1 Tax=Phocaeicola plebeius TaxID=310297 RepID=UPI0026F32C82|nr:HepT-like ribonuclease domain-containing protein [Phocaeicola plebeius]MCI6051421.1 DUF86 domain-containing protein [Phocaeicola plebeius]MDD6913377.1 DUF86 domain-containing protein [Phocaeicola plebeius]MDY5978020.1 HepT-like ribonuclease domain-containing protein [Phocaeicola plebeius]
MYKKEHVVHLLQKIKQTLERIIANSKEIDSYQYYYLTPAGMERLESTCMLLIAVGESIKGIDKLTNKELLTQFPEIDWKGAMGIRDIIAHHYFDLDAEIVYNVVKTNLPDMLATINSILEFVVNSEE